MSGKSLLDEQWQCREKSPGLWLGTFEAMKSPCEIWLETDQKQAHALTGWAAREAWRIEHKYSRFRNDSVLSEINRRAGQWQRLDDETLSLLRFADECWQLTDGMIDITIGGYLQYWKFDTRTPPPTKAVLQQAAASVGWDKVQLKENQLYLAEGMQLDLGGIGKEYAVDAIALALSRQLPSGGIMVNFGGDLNAIRPRKNQQPWSIGVESIRQPGQPLNTIHLKQGAVATSGSIKRYAVDHQGNILGHILSPKTGWPVKGSPASVTVVADTASQCGMLSTYAMLQGEQAENFLKEQDVLFFLQ